MGPFHCMDALTPISLTDHTSCPIPQGGTPSSPNSGSDFLLWTTVAPTITTMGPYLALAYLMALGLNCSGMEGKEKTGKENKERKGKGRKREGEREGKRNF